MFKNLEFLALTSYELKQDQIDIWQFPLTAILDLADSLLSNEEKARAKRFYFPRHQRRFATARTMMRVILARYLNEEPGKLLFDYNPYGKPGIHSNKSIQFNLSHSGDLALLAVGHTHPMGIDLEFFSERPYSGIAKELFSAQEIEAFEALPETKKALGFFTIWSQKEAFIKACGMGLSYPTQEFSVPVLPPVNEFIFDKKHQKHWAMTSFMPTSECSAALCCDADIRSIRKIDLTNEMMATMLSASVASFKSLNEESIRHYLSDLSFIEPINFHIVNSIDSTHTYLKNTPSHTTEISVCIAETQTNGHGRLGRRWVSPFGENIYLSSRWTLDSCVSKLAGLSLVVSLAIQTSLKQQGINEVIQVKWPNDLLWQHKKLCGVLIDVIPDIKGRIQVIIGIGLNVNTAIKDTILIDKPWCSLHEMTHQYFDRNKLIAHLLLVLNSYLKQFIVGGFNAFLSQWKNVDYLKGHQITLMHPNGSMQGYANGVSEKGYLYLIDDQGKQHEVSSGEASLIKVIQ